MRGAEHVRAASAVGPVSALHSACPRRASLPTGLPPLSASPTSESGLQQIGPAVPHVGRGLRKLSGPDSGPIELQPILSDSIRAATSKPTTGILPSTRLIEWLVPIAGQRCGDGGGRRPVGQPGMGSLRTIRTRSAPARGRLPTALGDLTGTSEKLFWSVMKCLGKGLNLHALDTMWKASHQALVFRYVDV